jgi:hypothetical protein
VETATRKILNNSSVNAYSPIFPASRTNHENGGTGLKVKKGMFTAGK